MHLQKICDMNKIYYSKLIFEHSSEGRIGYSLPDNEISQDYSSLLPDNLKRKAELKLPEVDEMSVVRHYTNMSNNNFGVDTGFYPLGSCTMKYNPKINEEVCKYSGFANVHPKQEDSSVQGILEACYNLKRSLSEICGMSDFTLNPFAGAHGELTGLMVIRSFHKSRGDYKRTKIIVPDSAHGTNPASAARCGLQVVEVKSKDDGRVDIEALKPLLGDDIAGMMMTNPNTLGLFEYDIPEIAELIHACGGLMYYDGANMNPMLGKCRPGDMGFDVVHLNLHKTFSTPHGGGGPGAGPVGVRKGLESFLPTPQVVKDGQDAYKVVWDSENSLGSISAFLGNVPVLLRSYSYILTMGRDTLKRVGELSVLNAMYIREKLKDKYELPITSVCKHEFVFNGLKDKSTGVTTLDIAKRLLDYGFHAPTIYFPLLFHEALMIEPTESESKETLDNFIDTMRKIADEAAHNPELVKTTPHETPVKRLDEVKAAREPRLTYSRLQSNPL